jgi:hypothetical protein
LKGKVLFINYLEIAFRTIAKQKVYTLVNIFVLAGVLALIIALLTVSYQAIKAALANPVNALKYE